MSFLGRSLRPLGILGIVLFCVVGMLLSFLKRDLNHTRFADVVVGLTFFEDRFQDYKVRSRLSKDFDRDIVLVNIDDESLSRIGTWPIPRTVHAKMIRQLKHFGAKVVALDILYPEKAPVCGELSPDKDFANALAEASGDGTQTVILSYALDGDDGSKSPVPEELLFFVKNSQSKGEAATKLHVVNPQNFPIKELMMDTVQLGHIASDEDVDGVFRNYKFVANVRDGEDSAYFPSMGLMAFEAYTGLEAKLVIEEDAWGALEYQGARVEVSPHGETKIRYFGDRQNFANVSLYRLLEAKPDDAELRKALEGKMVFVGSSTTGAHDLRNTPIDPKLPGVYAHMNAAHMLINKYLFRPEVESIQWSFLVLAIGIAFIVGVTFVGNGLLDIAVLVLTISGAYYVDMFHFFPQGYEIRLFYCFFCFAALYSWNTFLNFQSASREKKQIKGTFSRYVSPAVVNEMLGHPDKLKVGGERRDITCLFSDVRDFTSISEGLTATELSGALNQYMGKMTDIVFETMGTLDKYIGDAIVALWGAPLDVPDHPAKAVRAAVLMMEALPAINADFVSRGLPEFRVGIGLNSGECSVGNMGSDKIFSYTALGDNMNLGARLEGLCKYYGAHIIISDATLQRLPAGEFVSRPLDSVKVKGKEHPVLIHEVIHGAHPMHADHEAFSFYVKAYELFLNKDFLGTQQLLEGILLAHPEDKPTARLLKVCSKWASGPVPDDFYVTTMTEK